MRRSIETLTRLVAKHRRGTWLPASSSSPYSSLGTQFLHAPRGLGPAVLLTSRMGRNPPEGTGHVSMCVSHMSFSREISSTFRV